MRSELASWQRWAAVFACNAVVFAGGTWIISVPMAGVFVWPAAGVGLGAVVLFGPGMLSAIFAGTFLVTLGSLFLSGGTAAGPAILLALAVAGGSALEAWVAAQLLLRGNRGRDALRRGGDFFRFIAEVTVAHLLGAGIGAGAMFAAGRTPAAGFPEVLVTWWCGSVVAVLVFTPLLFVIAREEVSRFRWRRARLEALGLLSLLFVVGHTLEGYAFFAPAKGFPSAFLIIPVLLLIGFRFRGIGVAIALLVLLAIAATGTLNGYAAFPGLTAPASWVYGQCFIGILAMVGMGFVAVLDERDDHLAEVESLNAELEGKVVARTRQLERINQELTDTISIVAHDVRGPVAGIRTLAHHMRWASLDLSTAEGSELLGEIERTSATAVAMMARLLDLQRANDRPGTPVVTDIVALVGDVCRTFEGAAREKGITLRTRLPGQNAPRIVDAEGVRFIATNLISNAIKFLSAGGTVEVRVSEGCLGNQLVVIDDGPGIAPGECGQIFQRFTRATNLPTAGESSTGLGLFIVRKLVLAMQGTLHVESAPGQGATFVVEWPAESAGARNIS